MSELIKPPNMFTPNQWLCSNKTKYGTANDNREQAQSLENKCDRLIEDVKYRTDKTMEDVEKKLVQRLNDINYWKSELDGKLEQNLKETESLDSCIVRLKKALEATYEPLHVANECLLTRDERDGIDLVSDDAHKNILLEIDLLKGVQALLIRTIEQANEQLRLNRKANYLLKKDISGKHEAHDIDSFVKSLSSYSESIQNHSNVSLKPLESFSPSEWQAYSEKYLQFADQQLQNSANMRSIIESILILVAEDQNKQILATNLSLKKRIIETSDAKGKLEEHLSLVIKEISNIEDSIQDLKITLENLRTPIQITEDRNKIRNTRPNIELCRDTASYRLLEQKTELQSDASSLQRRLDDAEMALKMLRRRQLDLEEEIQNKAHTLHIDEVQCLGMRSSILIRQY